MISLVDLNRANKTVDNVDIVDKELGIDKSPIGII
jgi:hypothetical protein